MEIDHQKYLDVSFAAAMALLDRAEYMKKHEKEKEAINANFQVLSEEVSKGGKQKEAND